MTKNRLQEIVVTPKEPLEIKDIGGRVVTEFGRPVAFPNFAEMTMQVFDDEAGALKKRVQEILGDKVEVTVRDRKF